MLSIENPPPDPPCPCEISPLKSSSDERASDKLALQEVDLFKPGVDVCLLPKFSIRDYVYSSRSKDIKTNWPFSQRNLQLCLSYGVKDLLPPFQPLDSVRNPPLKRCAIETSLLGKENVNNLDGKPSEPSDHAVLSTTNDATNDAPWNPKLAAVTTDVNLCRSGGEKDFPCTTTIHSQSEVESVPTNGLEAPVELEAAGPPPASQKGKGTTQQLGKKCRLIVKLSHTSDPNPTEDIASNCTALSEAMASKICPVCKTFSSSSNTTLNAHIDQCLSVESTAKWAADSKLTKHRIKPRKTRLMVDICATAPRCTLEELDRRNGSSWAADSKLPTQDPEVGDEGRRQRVSPICSEDNRDEGAVYIDASGTKLRILSKFNDTSSVLKVGKNPRPGKALKKGKGSKFFSTNKKRHRLPKHHKYMKLASQSKKFGSPKVSKFEICMGQEGNSRVKEGQEKKQHLKQLFKAQEQIKPSDSGTLRQWVCSKRTGLSKKINNKDIHQFSGYKLPVTKDLLDESDQHWRSDSCVEGVCVHKSPNASENPISSPESSKRAENSKYEAQVSGYRERSPSRKRAGSPLFGARTSVHVGMSLGTLKQNVNRSSQDSTSVHDSCMLKLTNFTKNHASLSSNKLFKIHAGPFRNSDNPPHGSTKLSWSCTEFSSEAMRLSGLRKNALTVSQSSTPESKSNVKKKYSSFKKPRVHFAAEMDEEVVAGPSEVDQQYDLMCEYNDNESHIEVADKVSLPGSKVVDTRQERQSVSISQWEEDMVTKNSQTASQCYGHDVGKKMVSSVMVNDGSADKFDSLESATKDSQFHGKDDSIDPSSAIAVGETMISLSKSVDPEYHRLTNLLNTQSNSLQSIEKYKVPLRRAEASSGLVDPGLCHGDDLFCADEVGNGIIGQNTHMGEELDSKLGQVNSFSEVEPIPIPGPPGSYLPSPRDMSSEDFQGNSSLTSSQVQSSEDQHELVDRDSSDSPISVTSTISNSTAARSDVNYAEQLLSAGPRAVQDKIRSGFLVAGIETGHLCCCSRKERISENVALNYQESQLLRRRTTAVGKQMGCNPHARANNLNARPEMFSFSSCTSSGSERVPVMKSPPMNFSSNAVLRFPSRGDCDSASPSASSPILRLMGKNLMVVNKDEDASIQLRQAQPAALNNCPNPQFLAYSGVSQGSNQNQDYHSSHRVATQASVIFSQDPHNTRGEYFDVRLSHINSNTPQTPTRAPAGMFINKRMDGSYAASLEPREYKDECNLLTGHNRPKNGLDAAATCDMEKVIATPDRQCRKTNSAAFPNKEIIIIDDVPESDADQIADDAKYGESSRGSQPTLAGISTPATMDCKSRHVDSLSCYQSQDPSPLGERIASFHASTSRKASASPVSWGCTSEGSDMLQRNPFMASSTTGPLRSTLYYSPSLT